jgi:hypothetical protein
MNAGFAYTGRIYVKGNRDKVAGRAWVLGAPGPQ